MPDRSIRVLLVGHCGPDAYMLRSAVRRALTDAEVVFVTSSGALESELTDAALLLVNRVLEGAFESDGGIDLIRRLADSGTPSILISNFPEAQAQAEAAGAQPGFGKRQLQSDVAIDRIRRAVGVET